MKKIILLSVLLLVSLNISAIAFSYSSLTQDFQSLKGLTWNQIWQHINKRVEWKLEVFYQGQWEKINRFLQIQKEYPSPETCKITMVFDAPVQGNYRLTFAFKKDLLKYTSIEDYVMKMEFKEYAVIFDWNDIMSIPGITYQKGFRTVFGERWAWIRFRKNNVPKFAHVELDPELTVTDTYGDSSLISSMYQTEIVSEAVQLDDYVATPFHDTWGYRMNITFNAGWTTENLVDFPVLVHLTASNFDFDHAQNDGGDLAFYDSDDLTVLAHEIEGWSTPGEYGWIWVKVPQIDSGSSIDQIIMYYGNETIADSQDAENVWDLNYVGVWHLYDKPDDSNSEDSTQYGFDLSKWPGSGQPIEEAGMIYRYMNHTPTETLSVAHDPILDILSNITIEVWWNVDNVIHKKGIVNKGDSSPTPSPYGLLDWSGPRVYFEHGKNATSFQRLGTSELLVAGQWNLITAVRTSTDLFMYTNGTQSNTAAISCDIASSGNTFVIGGSRSTSLGCDGLIDEVRISNVSRSANWVNASFSSMVETFQTYSDEEDTLFYYNVGWIFSVNLLQDTNATMVMSFSCNVSITDNEVLRIYFSQDNTTWYNSDSIPSTWNTLSDGINNLDLRPLAWDKPAFIYCMNFTRDAVEDSTPAAYSVTLTYSRATESGYQLAIMFIALIVVVPLIALLVKRG